MQICSADLAISSLAQKDDSHWGPVWTVWWVAFALSPFAHRKRITEHCSLRGAFNGNGMLLTATSPYLMFINNVIVTLL